MMNLMHLGTLVRTRRLALGLSQAQMANLTGLSRTTINLFENNALNDLGMVKGLHLMAVLGIELQASPLGRPKNALVMAIGPPQKCLGHGESLIERELQGTHEREGAF